MASLKEYQDYKTYQEAFRKMVGTLLSLKKYWPPCILPQVASTMEVSSHCITCVLIKTSHIINYPKTTPIATTTILVEEQEEWEVDQVLDSKLKRGKLWYLVEWKGFS
ncbi:hypothetical protein O181_080296 [Austropuccinia psidii MF-1]|uniref:Chromo domain-containing protein n=1 Tax=Austropuccinia psidii MF-1 TaxID=1389203 RepID=A0A9Q3IET7_9BASI|nr:hypothetical protein [Austropuccinia psidii MF-1]